MSSRSALVGVLVPFMLSAYAVFSISLAVSQLSEYLSEPPSLVLVAVLLSFIGGAAGGVMIGYVADRLGRRPAIMISSILFGASVLMASFMRALWELYALWFLVGVGVNSLNGVSYAVVVEVLRSSKGVFGGFMQGLYFVGFLLDVVTFALVRYWRPYFLTVGAVSLVASLAASLLVPETARRWARPASSMARMGRGLAVVTVGLTAIVAGAFMFSVPLLSVTPSFLPSMGLGQGLLMGLSLLGLASFTLAGYLSDRYGRLPVQAAFAAMGLASSALLIPAYRGLLGALALALMFFFTGYFGYAGVWAGETYPAEYRATATNVVFVVGRIMGGLSAVVAASLFPASLRVGTALTCIIANVIALAGSGVYLYGRRLEGK
ncbi:MFS transporter [Acidilobus saccharovorans]|uniref:MFS transporter n=1 Tax=Acidilobus saccharovorans TaxID=242703 RepID=UPI000AB40E41|nr:MFS transporter [Acidilobus saccharovorans]